MILVSVQGSYPDPTTWPDIIKAVTDPFSLLALIVLVLGILGYRALARQGSWQARIFGLLIVVVALTVLGLNATRVINSQRGNAIQSSPEGLHLSITFRGTHSISTPITVPFQISSGQVNFGCNEGARPVVTFNAPTEATQINATAQWLNTSNVKSQDQKTVITGNAVTAYGSIAGLDRDWIGNCPGGGHGELLLQGSYVVQQPTSSEPTTKSIQTSILPGEEKSFELPPPNELRADHCDIRVASAEGLYGQVILSITVENGVSVAQLKERSGKVNAAVKDSKLLVQVE